MKKLCGASFIFLMIYQISIAQQAVVTKMSQLDWLAGKWERLGTKPGKVAFEEWEKQPQGLKGVGITLRGADTVFVEKLSIKYKDDDLYYVAEVSHNAEPAWFKITQISDSGFVCENPEHDFPKKIEYKLGDSGNLNAVISGDGKSIPFTFQRVND